MDLMSTKDEDSQQDKNDEVNKSSNKKEIDIKKKQMTLNLDNASKSKKKQVISNGNNTNLSNLNSFSALLDPNAVWNPQMGNVTLESPDILQFSLRTPDVERFLAESAKLGTPTPSLASRNFVQTQLMKHLGISDPVDLGEHLSLQNENNNQNNNTISNSDSSRPPSNASSNFYQNSDQFNPQDDNSNATSLSVSGGNNSNCSFNTSNNSANNQSFNENADLSIGMLKNQDLSKLERKRQRNRIAASKCRKRKLERISSLEDRVQNLKRENNLLAQEVEKLRERNKSLRSEVLGHKKNGCNIDLSQMQN